MKQLYIWAAILLCLKSTDLSFSYANMVHNSGFEEGYTAWSFVNTGMGSDGGVINLSALNPNNCFPVEAEHGNCYFYSNGVTVYQALTDDSGSPILLETDTMYTVGAQSGVPLYFSQKTDDVFTTYANVERAVDLYVLDDNNAPQVLCTVTMPDWVSKNQSGTWQKASNTFTADSSNPYLGKPLCVRLMTAGIQGSWDNIFVESIVQTFVVEPFSDQPITPSSTLATNLLGKILNFTATPGEYESASFVLRSTLDLTNVTFEISDLTGSDGILASTAMDLKVVKCWFQGGAAWRNESPLKTPRILIPELLLNDYDLVHVDEVAEKNFLRYGVPGSNNYVDVSDPTDNNNILQIMPVAEHPIYDTKTLQPLSLTKNRNQQFFLTFHAPADAVAGLYTGTIKVKAGGQSIVNLNVIVRILPFKLIDARTYYNPDKPFIVSVYFNSIIRDPADGSINYFFRNPQQYQAELADLTAHGVTHPTSLQLNCAGDFDAKYEQLFREHLRLRRQAGLVDRPIYLVSNPMINLPSNLPNTTEGLRRLKNRALTVMAWVEEELGHRDVYFYGQDEASGESLVAQIPYWQAIQQVGGKIFCSGYRAQTVPPGNFALVGDIQNLLICAGESDINEANQWHSKSHDIWCYAYPQSACENPEVYRRNFGMVIYKSNYDGAATFCYYMGFGHPWNDFDSTLQRDINFVYPTADGVVDTIHFAGYREAFDDIRYASTLKLTIRDGLASGKASTIALAQEANQFLAERDVYHADLNETRTIIIDYILHLQSGLNPTPGDANSDGLVDVGDLGILAANYGITQVATWAQGDFNGDGGVDVGDLGILAANYGTGTSSANWTSDYAQAFGHTMMDDSKAEDEINSSLCSNLGLPFVMGLAMIGLMLAKLDE